MFIPEFSSKDSCILVHNHSLETPEAVFLSSQFTRARLANGKPHLPSSVSRIEVVFDCRGQTLDASVERVLNETDLGASKVTFKEE